MNHLNLQHVMQKYQPMMKNTFFYFKALSVTILHIFASFLLGKTFFA